MEVTAKSRARATLEGKIETTYMTEKNNMTPRLAPVDEGSALG